ncbi:MAG: tRNA-dihydrouridine synthase family protein [Bacteroidales bacterium]|nr:tRNA-dihydrouridine synthase family protein [Bacteroidales bacterium]
MIYLAPLQGYTEVEFRQAWASFFTGIDVAVSPFIPLSESLIFKAKHLRDVMPDLNSRIPVIPQVLGNEPGKFIRLAHRLADLGYETVNWNLGCPKLQVARKQRGSGLLPFPDKLRAILEKMIPQLPLQLSIKTRLGFQSPDEFYDLIGVYNDFPLESLMIHPRIGSQMYEGELYLNVLDQVIGEIRHPIVFSGDIVTIGFFEELKKRYPVITRWMLGRGVLVNPFLPEILVRGTSQLNADIIRKRQYNFHDELYCEIRDKYKRERTILNKMKDFWSYFARWFVNDHEIFYDLSHFNTLHEFVPAARMYLHEAQISSFETRIGRPVG